MAFIKEKDRFKNEEDYSLKFVRKLPEIKEQQFKDWVWCNKSRVARCSLTRISFDPKYPNVFRKVILEDKSGNRIAEEYFDIDSDVLVWLEKMFNCTRKEIEEPFRIGLTTVPTHRAYAIIPEYRNSYIGDLTVKFDTIKEVEVYWVAGANDLDNISMHARVVGGLEEDDVHMTQEFFFESYEDAKLALELIKRNRLDSMDDTQKEIRSWFKDNLYKYSLTANHNKYEWVDSLVLNSYIRPIEIRDTYISRMLFDFKEAGIEIVYQTAPVLVGQDGNIYNTEDAEVTVYEERCEVICNGTPLKMCSYSIKSKGDLHEDTGCKIKSIK